MPASETRECCDCMQQFCLTCDEGSHCPDCGLALCDECRQLADDDRCGRCYQCVDDDPYVGTVQFPNQRRIGLARSKSPVKGKLCD